MMPVAVAPATAPALTRTVQIEGVPATLQVPTLQQILLQAGQITTWKHHPNANGSYSVQVEFADEMTCQKAFHLLNLPEIRMMLQAPAPVTVPAYSPRVTNDEPHSVEVTGLPLEMNEQLLLSYFQPHGAIEFHRLFLNDGHPVVAIIRYADVVSASKAIAALHNSQIISPSGRYTLQCKYAQVQMPTNVPATVPVQMMMDLSSQSRPDSPAAISSRSNSYPSLNGAMQELGTDSNSQPSSPLLSSPSLSPQSSSPLATSFSVAPLQMPVAALPMASALPAPVSQRLMVLPQQSAQPIFIPAQQAPQMLPTQSLQAIAPQPQIQQQQVPTFFYNSQTSSPQNRRQQSQKRVFPPGHALHKPVASDLGEGPIRGVGLFIFHLPLEATEHNIKTLFEQELHLQILRVTLMKDPQTGWNRGYGFINVETMEEAQRVITRFTGYIWCGKRLKVELKKAAPKQEQQQQIPSLIPTSSQFQIQQQVLVAQ